jgi:hypothetical protein
MRKNNILYDVSMRPDIPSVKDAIERLHIAKDNLETTQAEVRRKFKDMMATSQVLEAKINIRLNLIRLIDQITDVNIRFLKSYMDIYALEEPALFTTLSRGIFELHLILLEATSSEEKFIKTQFKIGSSYKSFIEKSLDLALKSKNPDIVDVFIKELERIKDRTQMFSEIWKIDLRTLKAYSKHFNFEEIAKKNGLLEDYRFDYGLLSSFLHPSDLYILTSPPIPGTMNEEKQKLAEWNVRNRRELVKNECTRVALIYSQRNCEKVSELIDQFR